MKPLNRKEDPTGFLNLFRAAASHLFGDPNGYIQGRGRWHHDTKKGPGRWYDRSVHKPVQNKKLIKNNVMKRGH